MARRQRLTIEQATEIVGSPDAVRRSGLTETDVWQAWVWRQAALAGGEYLSQAGERTLNKQVRNLSMTELEGIVINAICRYSELREQKRKQLKVSVTDIFNDPDPLDDMGFTLAT